VYEIFLNDLPLEIVRLLFPADLYFPAGNLVLVLNLLSYLLITFLKSYIYVCVACCIETRAL